MAKIIDIVVPDLGDFEDVEVIERACLPPVPSLNPRTAWSLSRPTRRRWTCRRPRAASIEDLTVAVGDKVNTGTVIGKLRVSGHRYRRHRTGHSARADSGDTTVLPRPHRRSKEARSVPACKHSLCRILVISKTSRSSKCTSPRVTRSAIEDPLVYARNRQGSDGRACESRRVESRKSVVKVGDKVSEGTSLAIVDAVATSDDVADEPADRSAARRNTCAGGQACCRASAGAGRPTRPKPRRQLLPADQRSRLLESACQPVRPQTRTRAWRQSRRR